MQNDPLTEIRDRTRRIETRLTRYLESTGFDVQVQRPLWNNNGTIRVPSKACSLNDCLSVVPDSWDPEVEINVYCKDDHLMSFFLTPLE
jgi:hypothetical protein